MNGDKKIKAAKCKYRTAENNTAYRSLVNEQIDSDGAAKLAPRLIAGVRLDALVHGRDVHRHIVLLGEFELARGALERALARVHLPKVLLHVALGVAAERAAHGTRRTRQRKSVSA